MTERVILSGPELPVNLDSQVNEIAYFAHFFHFEESEYHNFSHPWDVYETAMELADVFEAKGDTVDRRSLAFAAMLHDIYTVVPLTAADIDKMHFTSVEDRSAAITYHYLLGAGYDKDTVAKPVYDLIISTKRGQQLKSTEAVILRMADIYNTNQPFEIFEDRARAMHAESIRYGKCDCSFEVWLPSAMDYLRGFYDDPKIPDSFKVAADDNVNKILTKYSAVA